MGSATSVSLIGTYSYVAYGLHIESDFKLPGIPDGCGEGLDTVQIQIARPEFFRGGFLDKGDNGDFLSCKVPDNRMHMVVQEGKRVVFFPHKSAGAKANIFSMQSLATGFAFALLLRQRGHLVLHASILERNGQTIGFIGNSGCGKSTLAEYFSQHGFEVLSDDIGAIDTAGEVHVIPGYPMVKLRKPSADWLLKEEAQCTEMLDGRKYVPKSTSTLSPLKLNRLYLLEESFSTSTNLSSIPSQELIVNLIRHTHGNHLLTRQDYQSRLLRQCSTVANNVPTRVLQREQGLEHLPKILNIVEADLSHESGAASDTVAVPE